MLGNFGLLKNLVKLLRQQLLAHSATGGPRKAECSASPALKFSNAYGCPLCEGELCVATQVDWVSPLGDKLFVATQILLGVDHC